MSRATAARAVIGELIDVSVPGFTGPVHVRCDGPVDGPVILLVHGFSGSMHWVGALVAPLATSYRMVRVDLLGHGSTRGPAADAPLQSRAVAAVLDRLDVHGVTAVGHSFGADVVVDLAEHSDRVDRVVIVCQAPDYSTAQLPPGRALMTVPVLGGGIHGVARAAARSAVGVVRVVRPNARNLALAEQAVLDFRALNSRMFRVVLTERGERMAVRPLDAQLRDAGVPALAIVGGQDALFGDRYADRYRAVGAEVVVLPESGHSPVVQMPGRVVELIQEFDPVGVADSA